MTVGSGPLGGASRHQHGTRSRLVYFISPTMTYICDIRRGDIYPFERSWRAETRIVPRERGGPMLR